MERQYVAFRVNSQWMVCPSDHVGIAWENRPGPCVWWLDLEQCTSWGDTLWLVSASNRDYPTKMLGFSWQLWWGLTVGCWSTLFTDKPISFLKTIWKIWTVPALAWERNETRGCCSIVEVATLVFKRTGSFFLFWTGATFISWRWVFETTEHIRTHQILGWTFIFYIVYIIYISRGFMNIYIYIINLRFFMVSSVKTTQSLEVNTLDALNRHFRHFGEARPVTLQHVAAKAQAVCQDQWLYIWIFLIQSCMYLHCN